jgi:hypothetical protein
VGADMRGRGAAAGSVCIRSFIIESTLPSSIVGTAVVQASAVANAEP